MCSAVFLPLPLFYRWIITSHGVPVDSMFSFCISSILCLHISTDFTFASHKSPCTDSFTRQAFALPTRSLAGVLRGFL